MTSAGSWPPTDWCCPKTSELSWDEVQSVSVLLHVLCSSTSCLAVLCEHEVTNIKSWQPGTTLHKYFGAADEKHSFQRKSVRHRLWELRTDQWKGRRSQHLFIGEKDLLLLKGNIFPSDVLGPSLVKSCHREMGGGRQAVG